MKQEHGDDALPAVLMLLMVVAFIVQAVHHKHKVEADRAIIETQSAQLNNLRSMLSLATEPVDYRDQRGRKLRPVVDK